MDFLVRYKRWIVVSAYTVKHPATSVFFFLQFKNIKYSHYWFLVCWYVSCWFHIMILYYSLKSACTPVEILTTHNYGHQMKLTSRTNFQCVKRTESNVNVTFTDIYWYLISHWHSHRYINRELTKFQTKVGLTSNLSLYANHHYSLQLKICMQT